MTLFLFLRFLAVILRIINFAVFVRVIFSWFPQFQHEHNRFFVFIRDVTEPFFTLARRLPHRFGLIDVSPLYVIFFLQFLMAFIDNAAYSLM